MGYSSKGRRPFEAASKSSHHHIINDPEVQKLVARIEKPPTTSDISVEDLTFEYVPPPENPIEEIIAVDGGYTEAVINKEYPSRLIHFLHVILGRCLAGRK